MELFEQQEIALSRENVWKALVDPGILRQCINGCESLERLSETEFMLLIGTRVGPLRTRFTGRIQLADLNPPESYTMLGSGRGGIVGSASGSARIVLEHWTVAGSVGTLLSCTVEASIGGKLARVGSRLVDVAARKMTSDFMGRFAELLEK